MNHLHVLVCEASNGFGQVIVAVPPGDDPFRWASSWFQQRYKKPLDYLRQNYKHHDIMEFATDREGVISVVEYFDGAASYGRQRPTRYDFLKGGSHE